MERLIVKNFGPLKDVDIELNKINLFIGENASGKSVLAKIVTIALNTISNASKSEESILQEFKSLNIEFIVNSTVIKFISKEDILFQLKNKKIIQYFAKELNQSKVMHNETKLKIKKDEYVEMFNDLLQRVKELEKDQKANTKTLEELENQIKTAKANHKNKLEKNKLSHDVLSSQLEQLTPKYIPAERNLISLFNQSIYTLLSIDNLPLPRFLIDFFGEFEKAKYEVKELNFLNVKYLNSDKDRIYYDDSNYLDLEHSSSGIQSALPLYLTIKYFTGKYRDIVIEEPEQNLFPKAQAETIKYIVGETSNKSNLYIMTHSPYILSTLNNLIFAYKVSQLSEEAKNEVEAVCNEKEWVNPDEFSAYYLVDGKAQSIVSKRGLISENEIDDISDELGDDFDELMEIYREFRND